jgi:predicted TIM-barrel fold metal-dependent hydrolase
MNAQSMRPINVSSELERGCSPAAVSIDVHHHFNPTLKDNEGYPWSVQMALDELDQHGVSTAIASLGPVNDSRSRERPRRVRDWNEWATRTCLDHPGRFGLFASIPVPNIDLAVAEIAYAYDVLHADGIGLSTNEDDIWLSDERNWPVFAELNYRKAVVFVHPAPTSNCASLSKAYGGDLISSPWLEFPMNTARAILGLLTKGVTRKYSDIRFIFSHGGGTMPFLLGRIAGFAGWRTVGPEKLAELFPDGIYAEFGRLYFECAQTYAPETMTLLRQVLPASHILFGSDFSYFAMASSVGQFCGLQLDEDVRRAIGGGNAAAFFPRFHRNDRKTD